MINPPTRPYLPEEIERIKLSELVETKRLADIELENQIPNGTGIRNVGIQVKSGMINKKTILLGSLIIFFGIAVYIIIRNNQKKKE